MASIAPPRPVEPAPRMLMKRDVQPEPPTDRALWPTFMRRTLDDEQMKASLRKTSKTSG